MIDWLIHARKHVWDVYLIVQDAGMIDKQVREALIEYQCRCMNLSKIRIPIIGKILSLFHDRLGYLPKAHTVTARTGYGAGAIVADRWMFKGNDLHACYDTRQIFTDRYDKGAFSSLPPWDWKPSPAPLQWLYDTIDALKGKPKKPIASLPARDAPYQSKGDIVNWIRRLPAERRIAFMRRHGLC
jgi:hypothetical protein